jgi:hypothetical protein
MRVDVALPCIAGDTVVFRWTQSAPNPYQQTNEFFLRYEGIDLQAFSPVLFLEIFLGLQLGVFAVYGQPVEVVLPVPVPRPTVDYWRTYHDADSVTIGPVAEDTGYFPWRVAPVPSPGRRSIAVFFGGGKDSTLTACLLSELQGKDDVLVVQYVVPSHPGPDAAARVERRQDGLMLRPVRENLGLATRRVWTDYLAQMRIGGYRGRPHAELYTLGALPLLLSHGVSLCTFCLSWTEYGFVRGPDGRPRFQNARSRPEVLATQSAHYRRALGTDLTVTNLNLLFTGLSAVRLLTERYPRAYAQFVSCTFGDVDQRWCYRCRKCAWYPFFGLHCGVVDPTFDYDRLLRTCTHLRRMAAYATTGVERSPTGNAPRHPSLKEDHVFPMFCHVVAGTDPRLIAGRHGPEAYANLATIKALFGNRSYPGYEAIPAKAIDLLDNDLARRVAGIAANHLAVVTDLPPSSLSDAPEVEYDFGVRMPTKTEHLPHSRAGSSGASPAV